jgi:tetratricopeptide (TPR) repeat protein
MMMKFVVALLLLCLIGCTKTMAAANVHLVRGDRWYSAWDNDQALYEYQLAYKEAPRHYETLLRLVRLHNDIGILTLRIDKAKSEQQYRTALAYADTLYRLYPDSAASCFWIALAKGSVIPFVGIREKIRLGKEVRDHLRETLRHDSTFSYAYVAMAVFEREGAQLNWLERGIVRIIFGEDLSGTYQTAKQELYKALSFDPSNSFAYYELYWTYKAMGDAYHGADALKHVLTIVPKNLREKHQQDVARSELAMLTGQKEK